MRKYYILGVLIILIPFLAFRSEKFVSKKSDLVISDTLEDPLSVYGEYIFNREHCIKCHSLPEQSDSTKVSLDGIAGRYSDVWHYLHLYDPSSVSAFSKMPAYARLENNLLDSSVFFQLIPGYVGNVSKERANVLWSSCNAQADSITNRIKNVVFTNARPNEIIALISFLQTLPASREKQKRDSISRAEYEDQGRAWERSMLDSNSILFRTAIRNDRIALDSGALAYTYNCRPCHGDSAKGAVGPNLTDSFWLHGSSIREIATTIGKGIPAQGMKSWRHELKPEEIGYLIAYIKSLEGLPKIDIKGPQGVKKQ